LPLMSAMARMSNQNVSGCDDKSHETKKKTCPTWTGNTFAYKRHKKHNVIYFAGTANTQRKKHTTVKSKNSRHNLKLEQDVLEKGKGKMDTKIKASWLHPKQAGLHNWVMFLYRTFYIQVQRNKSKKL
jgi:IS30 family transposase